MRTIFLFLFVVTVCNAQYDYKKFITASGCKVLKHVDEFDKMTYYRNDYIEIGNGKMMGNLKVIIFNAVDKDGTSLINIGFSGAIENCRNAESYVDLILVDGTQIRLKNGYKDIKCGITEISVSPDNESIEKLTKTSIDKVRLSYKDMNEDFVATPKGSTKFKEILKCLSDIKTP